MIAPLRSTDPQTHQGRRHLGEVRRALASAFFSERSAPTDEAPPIRAWQAWAFTAWVLGVTGIYFACMFGLL